MRTTDVIPLVPTPRIRQADYLRLDLRSPSACTTLAANPLPNQPRPPGSSPCPTRPPSDTQSARRSRTRTTCCSKSPLGEVGDWMDTGCDWVAGATSYRCVHRWDIPLRGRSSLVGCLAGGRGVWRSDGVTDCARCDCGTAALRALASGDWGNAHAQRELW